MFFGRFWYTLRIENLAGSCKHLELGDLEHPPPNPILTLSLLKNMFLFHRIGWGHV